MSNKVGEGFIVSKTEIIRREKAFATLCISLLTSVILALNNIILNHPMESAFGLISFGLLLILANVWLRIFFNNFLKVKVYLTKTGLRRVNKHTTEEIIFKNIKYIAIKRTTNNIIREIKIVSSTNPIFFINGLDNSEQIKQRIVENLTKGTTVKEYREHINFDHPLFYVFFGIISGAVAVYVTRYLLTLDANVINAVSVFLILYILAVVIYLFINKPISSRYGSKK